MNVDGGMPMPEMNRRIWETDRFNYAIFSLGALGITLAWGVPIYSYCSELQRKGLLDGLVWVALIGGPVGLISLVVIIYGLLGVIFGRPWMEAHFGWLYWVLFDEEQYAPKPVDPNSAGGIIGQTLDRIGDRIKNTFLDLSSSSAATEQAQALNPPPLPPMNREDLAEQLRTRVDELLKQMADEINQAPTGQILDHSEERVHQLVHRLEDEVLQEGLKLRIDAAYAALPENRRPQGDWARKYRMMISAGKRQSASGAA
jgi:hypothetical protein